MAKRPRANLGGSMITGLGSTTLRLVDGIR
ncbi:hypothetical protein FHR29_004851 [Sphingobacterium sp. JUb56]|nr:hypothetical protein [Sphingobacterium sp. JUb56]